MVLYANDEREWVKKTLLSICCSMNNNCMSGNKERVSLKILCTVSITVSQDVAQWAQGHSSGCQRCRPHRSLEVGPLPSLIILRKPYLRIFWVQ